MSTPRDDAPNMLSATPLSFYPQPSTLFLGKHVQIDLDDGSIKLTDSATKEQASRELWDFIIRYSPFRDLPQFLETCNSVKEVGHGLVWDTDAHQQLFDRFAKELDALRAKLV